MSDMMAVLVVPSIWRDMVSGSTVNLVPARRLYNTPPPVVVGFPQWDGQLEGTALSTGERGTSVERTQLNYLPLSLVPARPNKTESSVGKEDLSAGVPDSVKR